MRAEAAGTDEKWCVQLGVVPESRPRIAYMFVKLLSGASRWRWRDDRYPDAFDTRYEHQSNSIRKVTRVRDTD